MEIREFAKLFETEEACAAYLARIRWPSGPVCPHCAVIGDAWKMTRPRYWACRSCGRQFSVTEGTPLEHTRLPLPVWFMAVFLIATSSKGVSALKLSAQLGISYKSAWFLGRRIRQFMGHGDATLRGIVEVDETYLGGKRSKRAKSKRERDDDQSPGRGRSRRMTALAALSPGGTAKAKKGRTHSERTIARAMFDWLDWDSLPAGGSARMRA